MAFFGNEFNSNEEAALYGMDQTYDGIGGIPFMVPYPQYPAAADPIGADALQDQMLCQYLKALEVTSSPRSDSSSLSTAPSTPANQKITKLSTKQKKKKKNMVAQQGEAGDASIADAGMPSRGSKNHDCGQCRPCRNFFSPGGCAEGILCNFCHFPHDHSECVETKKRTAKMDQPRSFNTPSSPKRTLNLYNSCFDPEAAEQECGLCREPMYVPIPSSFLPPGL